MANKDKSIVFILPDTRLGGAEQVLRMIAIFYAKLGYKISIIILKYEAGDGWKNLSKYGNVEIKFLSTSNFRLFGVLSLIRMLLFENRITHDIVFSSHIHLNALIGLLRRFRILKAKYVVGRESTSAFLSFKGIKLSLIKLLYLIGYQKLDILICQTNLMKDQLLKNLPFLDSKCKVLVIPNPIDLDTINARSKEKVNLEQYKPFIVAAGRLIPIKGFEILILAFSKILSVRPNMNLVILGEGADRDKLTSLIKELNIVNNVHLVGHVENVLPYFRQASLCVVSSLIEGFPNVLLQMMSQNNSIVSTLCCGDIDSIPNINTAQTNDVDSLLSAMILNLDSNNDGNREIFDNYLEKRQINNFIATLENAISNIN